MHRSEQLLQQVMQVNSYSAAISKKKGYQQTEYREKLTSLPTIHSYLFKEGGKAATPPPPPQQTLPKTSRDQVPLLGV